MIQISNQKLNILGDRFVIKNIRGALGITFEQYLADPDRYDRQADQLRLKLDAAGNIEIIGDSLRRSGRIYRELPPVPAGCGLALADGQTEFKPVLKGALS